MKDKYGILWGFVFQRSDPHFIAKLVLAVMTGLILMSRAIERPRVRIITRTSYPNASVSHQSAVFGDSEW